MGASAGWVLDAAITRAELVRARRMRAAGSRAALDVIRFCSRRRCMPAGGGRLDERGLVSGSRGFFVGDDGRWWVFADRLSAPGGQVLRVMSRALSAAAGSGSSEVDRVGRLTVVSNRFVAALPKSPALTAVLLVQASELMGAGRRG